MTPTEPAKGGWFSAVRRALRGGIEAVLRPELDVTITVPTAQASDATMALLDRAVRGALSGHAEALGVQSRIVVKPEPAADAAAGLRVLIAGRAARVVPGELSEALAAQRLTTAALRHDDGATFAEAVATACRVAVEWDPATLVGPAQQQAMLENARDSGIHQYPDAILRAALKRVVAQGISIADLSRLKAALDEPATLIETAGELSEVAIDALRPRSIGVRTSEATLRSVTTTGTHGGEFAGMRARLFSELGVTFPDIEAAIDDSLPEGTAAVRLNDVLFTARPLPPDAGASGIVAVVERQLRNHAAWFVSIAEVRQRTEEVRLALPDLLDAVQERYSEPQLAVLGRAFVEERVPVRNAARLLTLLMDMPGESTGRDLVRLAEPVRAASPGGEWPSPRQFVSFTRQEMNEEAARSRPGITTVHPTRLPADLDTALASMVDDDGTPDAVAGPILDQLIALAVQEIEQGDPILVAATQRSRAVAKNLLASQYPEVAVCAAEEYPPSQRLAPPD